MKERKQKISNENCKKIEISMNDGNNFSKYNSIKNKLDAIYDHITEGIRTRSTWDWCEYSEKSANFF